MFIVSHHSRMNIVMSRQKLPRINRINRISGFSLIELLVTIGVMAVLLAVSLPNFQAVSEAMTTNSQAKALMNTLNLARNEAVKRGTTVSLCASTNGTDCSTDNWSAGWMVFVDANGDANGGAGSVDAGDAVIRVYDALSAGSNLTFTVDLMQYNSLGYSDIVGIQTLLVCPATGNDEHARAIEIGLSGRGRRIEGGLTCP
jgi:type IV fimbrial biogenesis protein FimT